ncbi:type II toxin-antitoxin system PemK/MazF family toxin [Clostridium sp. L74]|uniref:type II toxin-antitoxin system PemK/MazF family toxin n=1 Tax=Clostridium sp. L74 TaxID=1560217 RepID=UPI0006C02C32|nr:type II toxin-antitoxin system PemK/MazF family toxin [Clostridium sp. L74]KOR25396.1 transcriptional modulator of MazE/toxin, MazF [Clostridium sp. L74]
MGSTEKKEIMIELSKAQKCLEWIKTMLFLDTNAKRAAGRIIKRGEVYKCKLGFGVGSEENKERPCVILQYDGANTTSPNTIVAPITHTAAKVPIVIPIADKADKDGNIILDGNVLLGNIVCVSKARLGEYKATLTSDEMKKVDAAIAKSLDIKRHYDKLNKIVNDKEDYIKRLKEKILKIQNQLNSQSKEISTLEKVKHMLEVENTEDLLNKIEKILKNNMDKQ